MVSNLLFSFVGGLCENDFSFSSRLPFLQEALQIPEHLVGIELDAHILDAQSPTLIHERREKSMIHIAARRLLVIDAIAFGDLADLSGRPGEKRPAGGICMVRLGVTLEDLRRVALRINSDGKKVDLRTKVRTEAILDAGHLRREKRTGVRAACKDKCDRENLATKFLKRRALPFCLGKGKLRPRFALRNASSNGKIRCGGR